MINIIIGLFLGAAVTLLFSSENNRQQGLLIEQLNRDLIREKQRASHYRTSLRLERQIYSEMIGEKIKEKYKEVQNGQLGMQELQKRN